MTKAEKEIANYIAAREIELRNGIVTVGEAAECILKAIRSADQFCCWQDKPLPFDNMAMYHKAFLMLARVTK